ncbi:hypothetical protein [Pseudotamlana carrageenivorans]|uniref:hypothetical protein n=1 Tax=Pseudotamlana carrageenivorans TaxID=2069432 RepID=UPI0013153241|nr:hypothetical protein [Tamlana carrageenivorans]
MASAKDVVRYSANIIIIDYDTISSLDPVLLEINAIPDASNIPVFLFTVNLVDTVFNSCMKYSFFWVSKYLNPCHCRNVVKFW